MICRCEEITLGKIEEAIANGLTSLSEIRKFTRAGMGLCQGRTCQRLVIGILARHGIDVREEDLPKTRSPVLSLKLGDLSDKA